MLSFYKHKHFKQTLTVLDMQNRLISDHWCKSRQISKTLCLKTKTETKTLIFVLEAPRDQDTVLDNNITAMLIVNNS